ncbi:MAG: ABC transporter ATP-binding protein [Oscillospiraceae bacterium]|nr:ABC transporter ATP-binding protein [Oscillospiraceae bacterium]
MKIGVNNLNFSYGSKRVLQVSNVSFEQGKAYGIVGKNGAGKTTFFKCLVNIITNYQGSVLIDGLEVRTNLNVLGNVGIVLDDMSPYRNRTGMFNLRYFAGLRGGMPFENVMKLADELEISGDLETKVSKYSLGMTKKLQLLISLMNDAEILIFDEPFRGLDAKTVDWFRGYLTQLKQQGRTILISSHVQEDIESIADHVFVLENGDFSAAFDLSDTTQDFIYSVEVSDPVHFRLMLEDAGVSVGMAGKLIQFTASEELYRKVFKQAVAKDIEFYQVKKEVQFAKFVR